MRHGCGRPRHFAKPDQRATECRDLRHFARSAQRIETKIQAPFCQSPERVIRGARGEVVRWGQDRCRTKVVLRFGAGRSSLLELELVRGKQLARSGGLAGGLDVLLQSARQSSAPVRTSFDGLPEGGARSMALMPANRGVRRQLVFCGVSCTSQRMARRLNLRGARMAWPAAC